MSEDDIKEVEAEAPVEVAVEETPVEVESDEPEAAAEAQPTGQKEVPPQEGIQELKKRLEAERQARQQAEQIAYQQSLEAQRHKVEADGHAYQVVLGGIKNVEHHAATLRSAFAEAMQTGDYEKAATIQEAIAENSGNLQLLREAKRRIERDAEDARRQQAQPVQPVATPDPIEQWASVVSPRAASWIRFNRSALQSDGAMERVSSAHKAAIAEGIEPDTDDYFEFIEEQAGLRRPRQAPRREPVESAPESALSAASAPAPRRSVSPPAAPVTRGGPRGNAVRLSALEREAARISGISDEEYAQNKAREQLRNANKTSL